MNLLDRISRLIRANLNDLLRRAEDPEKIIEQAVLDMKEALKGPGSRWRPPWPRLSAWSGRWKAT